MTDLSILIPSRNEIFLKKTIEDITTHSEADIEILAREDYGIGQRDLTNELAREAKGKYVMKVDAHCSFGQGFDRIMLEEIDDRTILTAQMGVLDGQTWIINGKKMTKRYCFGQDFVMKYDEENGNEETMCLQGSCFMLLKENYFAWNVCDETLGSWGGQAVELGIAAYRNGGRCRTTTNTYYGHVFRHSTEEFPYDRGENPGKFATEELIRRYKNKSIAGLIRKFGYPQDWTEETVDNLEPVV